MSNPNYKFLPGNFESIGGSTSKCLALCAFVLRSHLTTASNLCLLLQKEQNVKGGEGPSGKQAVGINNGTR